MVTANELLAQLDGVEERVCVIDLVTRKINIPNTITTLGVEHDDDVKRLNFRMPKMYGDVDMSTFNIRINYMNAANEGDIYVVTDKQVDGDIITFSWRVGPHAFTAKGNVNFIACFKGTDPSDVSNLRELNTTVASLPVLEGLEVDAAPLEGDLQDILEQLETLTADKIASVKAEGETQLEKLQTKSEEEQENIKGTADYIRSTFGDDYETTVKMARTRANAIVQTVEGESIPIDDASDDPLRGLRVFGKSTQITTTGKNLLQTSLVGTVVRNGVTFSPEYNSAGELVCITANGTAGEQSYVTVLATMSLPAGEYVLSGCPSGGSTTTYDVRFNGVNARDYGNGVKFTITSDSVQNSVSCVIAAGATANNLKFYPMIRQASTVDSSFEPYSGGHASPSPEQPQSIDSVTKPTVMVRSKNLFDGTMTTCAFSGNAAVFSESYRGFYLRVTPGKTYTVSRSEMSSNRFQVMFTVNEPVNNERIYNRVPADDKLAVTATVPYGCKWLMCYLSNAAEDTSNTLYQVEEGDVATGHEPYVEPQTITLNRTLPGIPVTSGGNYTDQNGQQWVCDEIDFERGVYVQRIGAAEYVGSDSEPWLYNTGIGLQKDPVFLLTLSKLNTTRNSTDRAIICNSYAAADKLPVQNNEYWKVDTYFGIKQVAFRNDNYTDLSGWKAYLKDHPIRLIYELATPIETALTDAELAAYAALHSNYPNTTVVNDSGAHMELKYNADTATFFIRSRASAELIQAAVDVYLDEHPVSVSLPKASIANGVLKIE